MPHERNEHIAEMATSLVGLVRVVENLRHTVAAEQGFADTEFKALARVTDAGEITPKDLSVSLDITTGAVTAITDSLVATGHLERVPNPADRRSLLLRPTPKGASITARTYEGFRTTIAAAMVEVSADEIRQLTRLLDRTAESLSSPAGTAQ